MSAPGALDVVVAAFPPALTDLPQLRITTKNGAPIDSKEIYVDATFLLTNPAAAGSDGGAERQDPRTRTLDLGAAQESRTRSSSATTRATPTIPDVLGMKKHRNWALLADYFDRSLMRNKLALSLGQQQRVRRRTEVDARRGSTSRSISTTTTSASTCSPRTSASIRHGLNIKKMSSDPAVERSRRRLYRRGRHAPGLLQPGRPQPAARDPPGRSASASTRRTSRRSRGISSRSSRTCSIQVEQDLYGPNRLDGSIR